MAVVANIKSQIAGKLQNFSPPARCNSLVTKSLAQNSRNYLLSDFLPYNLEQKIHTKLSDGLKEYKLLLIAAEQAFTLYLQGQLLNFDSLVGENACQIRATMLSLLSLFPDIEIKTLLEETQKILFKIDNFDFRNSPSKTLKNCIKENALHLAINHREAFLISSYILTKVRVLLPPDPSKRIVRNESTDTKKVKKISPVGSTFAREIVKKLRHFVSSASVTFVQEAASLLPIPNSYIKMVSEDYCVNHDKFGRLKCLPSFWYTFVLIQYSLAIELPLVFIVSQIATDRGDQVINNIPFYFKVAKGKYELFSRDEFAKNDPALVVLGSCCRKFAEFPSLDIWKQEILEYNPRDLLLSYAAAHRQYPDEEKDVLVKDSNCEAYNYYRSEAYEVGCSLENPSLFFLVHAYCDKIENVKVQDPDFKILETSNLLKT